MPTIPDFDPFIGATSAARCADDDPGATRRVGRRGPWRRAWRVASGALVLGTVAGAWLGTDPAAAQPGPAVTQLSPSDGPTSGGTTVSIDGANLAGATAVKFGTVDATSFTTSQSTYVADQFARTVTSGWGSADQGGAWTVQKGGGATGSESVDGASGVMAIRSARYTQAEQVLTVPTSALNFQFGFDLSWTQNLKALPSGTPNFGGLLGGVVARFQNANDTDRSYYRMSASWDANSGHPVLMLRAQSAGTNPTGGAFRLNVNTGIDPTADFPAGAPYAYHVKGQITGTNPTSFAMKIWKVGATEPAGWMLAGSDTSNVGPQVAGLVGFRGSCDLARNGTFLNFTGMVHVGNLSVTPLATSITAIAPPHLAGTVDVEVTTPDGTSAPSTADQFIFADPRSPPPTVTGVTPTTGPVTGGAQVTITGSAFTGATSVAFGTGAATAFTVNGPNSITATSPPGSGTVDVTVTTPSGTSATSSSDHYTFTGQPGAPTNLQASVQGSRVTLTWTNGAGALGANSYRDGRKYWAGGWPRSAPTTFTQTRVPRGTHRYTVADYDSQGQGPQSQTVTVIVP